MIDSSVAPLLFHPSPKLKNALVGFQKLTVESASAIHIAVPMFVHSYVPMQLRSLLLAGWLLGGRIVGERSNGVRSVGRPFFELKELLGEWL